MQRPRCCRTKWSRSCNLIMLRLGHTGTSAIFINHETSDLFPFSLNSYSRFLAWTVRLISIWHTVWQKNVLYKTTKPAVMSFHPGCSNSNDFMMMLMDQYWSTDFRVMEVGDIKQYLQTRLHIRAVNMSWQYIWLSRRPPNGTMQDDDSAISVFAQLDEAGKDSYWCQKLQAIHFNLYLY